MHIHLGSAQRPHDWLLSGVETQFMDPLIIKSDADIKASFLIQLNIRNELAFTGVCGRNGCFLAECKCLSMNVVACGINGVLHGRAELMCVSTFGETNRSTMNTIPKPFDCSYTPQFAELLHNLGISLAISTYQAGKVVLLSAVDKDKLVQLPRTFDAPMGMATTKEALAVATKDEVIVLRNSKSSALTYPVKQGVYDGIYLPRATYYTGVVAMHDMAFMPNHDLIGVNTSFSCLCKIDDKHSFTPFWKPPFIDELAPEDRCHLNGMAVDNGEIKYLSALGETNTQQGWRETKMNGGIVMEYPSGKIIADGLGMPHSPRIYNDELYVLNSTQGELLKIDRTTGEKEVISKLGGFARGMSRCGDYLFIGVSKLRHNSTAFNDLPIAEKSFAGVVAVYLPYGSIVGSFEYTMSVDEIYDVKVLADLKRPSVLSPSMPAVKNSLVTPEQSFWKTT